MSTIRKTLVLAVILLSLYVQVAVGERASDKITPPVAKRVPKKLEKHGHIRIDNYHWLKERDNPEVINYLKAENKYTDLVMAHTKALQETLFEEFKGRIKQTDMSVPYKKDDYYYYDRQEEGKEYPIYCRKKNSLENKEEIMLNINELAEGHEFIRVTSLEVSHKIRDPSPVTRDPSDERRATKLK